MPDLRTMVHSALETATENGYDMMEDPSFIAADLIMCVAEFETLSDDEQVELQDHVAEWQKTQKERRV